MCIVNCPDKLRCNANLLVESRYRAFHDSVYAQLSRNRGTDLRARLYVITEVREITRNDFSFARFVINSLGASRSILVADGDVRIESAAHSVIASGGDIAVKASRNVVVIDPPGRSSRFDARFFTADASAVAHTVEGVTGPDAELVELVWMPLSDAKQLDMPTVTSVMLDELGARIASGLRHDLPVPFYRMVRGTIRRDVL